MTRVFNFSAGPAALPEPVLRQAADEMLDWHGSGMSVMEMSHRGKEFIAHPRRGRGRLRELLAIPANYKVLFLQGGAIGENAIVPMNLLRGKTRADYVDTGEWSKKSIKEAKKYCTVNVAASGEASGFTCDPAAARRGSSTPDAAYVHICSNETIGGVEYHWTPDTGDVPLVADMSSQHPVAADRRRRSYGLIYGGAQKNIGPAGLTIVIVRDDLIGQRAADHAVGLRLQACRPTTTRCSTRRRPTRSTSPGWCSSGCKAQGGLAAIERAQHRARRRCCTTTSTQRRSTATRCARDDRSLMNVPFTLRDEALDDAVPRRAPRRAAWCSSRATASVGGMRASIYNAMPIEGVQALVAYMKEFEASHG